MNLPINHTDRSNSLKAFSVRRLLQTVLLALLTVTLGACGTEDAVTGPVEERATSIAVLEVQPSDVEGWAGDRTQLEAEVLDEHGRPVQGVSIRWTSDDTSIATVDDDGTVVFNDDDGTAVISASTSRFKDDTKVRNNGGKPGTVKITPSSATVASSDTIQLSAEVLDESGDTKDKSVKWESSDESIALVTDIGEVVGMKPGDVTITATSGPASGSAAVSVESASSEELAGEETVAVIASVEMTPDSSEIMVDGTVQLSATVLDEFGTELDLEPSWRSANSAVATVDGSGLVTGAGEGSAEIIATADDTVTDTVQVVVAVPETAPAMPSDVSVTETSRTETSVTFGADWTISEDTDEYLWRAGSNAGNWSESGTVTTTSSQFTAPRTSSPDTSYFCVQAVNDAGESEDRCTELVVEAESSDEEEAPSDDEESPSDTTLTTFSSHVFDDLSNGGEWSVWKDENLSIVTDERAPRSPGSVGRAFFPAGSSGGTDLGNFMGHGFKDEGATTLHVSTWFRYSDNWQGHDSGVNKILFLLRDGSTGGPVVLSAQGIDDGALEPQLRMQRSGETWSRVLEPNVDTGKKIVRGQWHRWEVRLQMNTDGNKDGTAEWWLDGVKVGSYDDVAWVPEGDPHVWSMAKFQPIWGGTKDMVEEDQYLLIDQIDIRGK